MKAFYKVTNGSHRVKRGARFHILGFSRSNDQKQILVKMHNGFNEQVLQFKDCASSLAWNKGAQ